MGIGAIAGAAVATLVLAFELPRDSGHHAGSAHQHEGLVPPPAIASEGGGAAFYSEMTDVNTRMHQNMAISPSGDVDRDFMRMMIPHHQGAIDMALVLLKYAHDEKLKRLAQSIIVEQGQEIAYMRTLLDPPRPLSPDTGHIADK